jgi:hypothetical protein
MMDRNRLRSPLASQGYGRPGTTSDFARAGETKIYRNVFFSWLGWLVPGTILVDVSNRRSALHKGKLSQVRQS